MNRRSRTATVAATTYPSTQKSATSSSGGIALPSFLFQPGATSPIAGVYTTFGALAAAVAAAPGMSTIYVDLSLSGDVYTPPAGNFNFGAHWNFKGLINPASDSPPNLNFANGTTITPPASGGFDDVVVLTPQAGAVITHAANVGIQYDFRGGASLSTATGPFLSFSSGLARIYLHDLTFLSGAGCIAISGGTQNFECLDKSQIGTASITHTGGTTQLIAASPGISIDRSYSALTTLVPGVPFTAAVAPGGSYAGAIGCLYCNTAGGSEGTYFFFKTVAGGTGGWEAVG